MKRCGACAGHEAGEDSVAVYRESPATPSRYVSKHGKSEEAGPLDGTAVAEAYAPLEGLQQKRLAARRHKTTYCYDFPSVFGTALRDIWTGRAAAGEPGSMPQGTGNPLVRIRRRRKQRTMTQSLVNLTAAWLQHARLLELGLYSLCLWKGFFNAENGNLRTGNLRKVEHSKT